MVISASGTVYHRIPRIKVDIVDIEPSIEAEDVDDAARGIFNHRSELGLKVPKKQEGVMLLVEVRALKLLKPTHMKIRWVSHRFHRKMEVNQC